MNTARNSKQASPPNDIADAGNMDKIRDILFGNQAKDYENRFSRMEERLTQEATELKAELIKRIDALESYTKQELKDAQARLKAEANERAQALKIVQREIKEGFDALNAKLLQDEENLAGKSTELRNQILEQSKNLSAEILSKYEQTSSNLKKTTQELDTAKVNRSDLSGFFLEVAMRLSGEDGAGPVSD